MWPTTRPRKFKSVADEAAFAAEQYGIAVKKGNADLLGKINKGLADIRADGTYDRIHARYFGARGRRRSRPHRPRRSKPQPQRRRWTCAGTSSPATARCSRARC